jgi:hypothetical protein
MFAQTAKWRQDKTAKWRQCPVRDADELKMFAWDKEDVKPVSLVPRSAGVVRGLAAELPNRRGARFAESSKREARPRDSARSDQRWLQWISVPWPSGRYREREEASERERALLCPGRHVLTYSLHAQYVPAATLSTYWRGTLWHSTP